MAVIAAVAVVLPTTITAAATASSATTGITGGPGASTTGVPSGVALTAASGLRITTAGAVIDAKNITGTVTVAAPGVVISRSRIHGSTSTPYGIRVESGSVKIVDSEVSGFTYGIAGANWTAQRVEVSAAAQAGVKLGSNVSLVDSWIHALGVTGGAAPSGAQLDSAAHDVRVQGNTIDMSGSVPATSAIFIKPETSSTTTGPLAIAGNWLDGGTYTVQLLTGSTGTTIAGTSVTDNRFGRDASKGLARVTMPAGASGNVWADTGTAASLPGTTALTTSTTTPSPSPTATATTAPQPTTSPSPIATTSPAPSPTATTAPAPAPTATTTPVSTAPVTTSTTTTARPGPTTTGVPAGTALSTTGSITVTTPNAVVDSKDVQGTITVSAPGVVVKNSRITGTGYYGVRVTSGDVTIVDTEISGFQNAISGGSWTGRRLNIHSTTQDGVKLGSNVLLEDSWIHDLTPEPGAHADGGQVQSGVVNVVVRHNVIDPTNAATGTLANSALLVKPDFGSTSPGPVVIEDNWLNGGNYTLFAVPGSTGNVITDIQVLNNRFGSTHRYGVADILMPVTASGNVSDATGAPITIG